MSFQAREGLIRPWVLYFLVLLVLAVLHGASAAGLAPGVGEIFNFLAYSRTITSNMLVRLRLSAAAHCSHKFRVSGVIFNDVAAVLRSGRGITKGSNEIFIAHTDIRYHNRCASCKYSFLAALASAEKPIFHPLGTPVRQLHPYTLGA